MMGDHAMCCDNECPLKARCNRHVESGRKGKPGQSWIDFTWSEAEGCGGFVDYRTVRPDEKAVA